MDPPRVATDQVAKAEGERRGQQLDHPIGDELGDGQLAAQERSERDGWVVVTAGDVAAHVDHRHQRATDRQRSERSDRAGKGDHGQEEEGPNELG